MQPKVIICCPTYNQEKYIEQALQGLIMQKTNFPFVVHVHDDCSTDDTKNIILKYLILITKGKRKKKYYIQKIIMHCWIIKTIQKQDILKTTNCTKPKV